MVVRTPIGIELGMFCTHLDHLSEDTRLNQWRQIQNFLQESELDQYPHLIAGDLNCLSHEHDYSEVEWNAIKEKRKSSNWERPRTELIQLIEEQGYVDCFKLSGLRDISTPTCWAGTRIDYIFASPKFIERGFQYKSHKVVNNSASDHKLVVVEFSKDSVDT